ncbi:related to 3-oxoacyl-(acyl carrier protein) reductase [Pseudozyma flocculosa]|uniref:3-oxoacyl-[acyl-carrier-protein] reductase n=1 Tax=Pseudozyma flocculosa TaxID=84751 RepID=A0A5C3F7Q1_9BASI|nr:related to 3-oxoacyl-(acyl carrier protein) reductase [Pseudozyma flocculosa]
MSQRVNQIAGHLGQTAPGPLLKGQVAIVTGSGQGIGKAAAVLFAAHGAHVVVSDLDAKKSADVAQEIVNSGGSAISIAGNVMDKDYGERVVKGAIDKWGKINIIVNNAGFTADKMAHTTDDETFQLMLDCHVVAPFRIIRAAAPYMRIKDASKRENMSIINISSTSGTHGNVGQVNYSAAKSATRLTAAKENGESIVVNGKAIALGIPGRGKAAAAADTGSKVTGTEDIPLGRPGLPEEGAAALLFFASPLASYVSGQTLEVTGGRGI